MAVGTLTALPALPALVSTPALPALVWHAHADATTSTMAVALRVRADGAMVVVCPVFDQFLGAARVLAPLATVPAGSHGSGDTW